MDATKLYRHFAEDGTLLYVGVSARTGRRQHSHLQNSAWAQRIARIEIENYETKTAALGAERTAIREERPLYNVQHKRSKRFTEDTIMISVRLPKDLVVALDRAIFEDGLNRTDVVTELLELGLSKRIKK